jgi:UDPglucose--hexose-1-phosphate uridylyltransferase
VAGPRASKAEARRGDSLTGTAHPFFRKHAIAGVEHRQDPLSGGWTRLNPDRAKRLRHTGTGACSEELNRLIEASRATCPFCPESRAASTVGFPPGMFPEPRPGQGQSVLIPNKDPFGENHCVGILTDAHYISMEAYTVEILRDGLDLSVRFFQWIASRDASARYPILVWNFLPPSAGSIVHPHTQILLESRPAPVIESIARQCAEWKGRTGEDYWDRLVQEESRAGERTIRVEKDLVVLASFAPRGVREILFILPGAGSLADLSPEQRETFCEALVRALKGYHRLGVGSFNLVTYSPPMDAPPPFPFHARLISRPFPSGIYTNDTGFFERMYDLWIIDTLPEDLTLKVRPFFEPSSQQEDLEPGKGERAGHRGSGPSPGRVKT